MPQNTPKARLAPSHKTYIPVAAEFRDFARKIPGVTCVSAGIIRAGLSPAPIRVKIVDESGCILLKVRGATSIQEMRVYTSDIQNVRTTIAREVRNKGYRLAFTGKD